VYGNGINEFGTLSRPGARSSSSTVNFTYLNGGERKKSRLKGRKCHIQELA